MTSLLARVGALEARLASQVIWNSGKRKRGDWLCTDCTRRGALKQRRSYSDNTVRTSPDASLPWALRNDEGAGLGALQRAFKRQRENVTRPWGLDIDDSRQYDVIQEGDGDIYGDRVNEMWAQAEEQETQATDAEDTQREANPMVNTRENDLLNLDYAAELAPALVQGSADMAARCLIAAARQDDAAFIQSIPATSFSECIRLLQPSNFTAGLTTAHTEISSAVAAIFKILPVDAIARENARVLREIKSIRNAAGIRCSLADYRMLLHAARNLGNKGMAENMWTSLLHDGVTPDVTCYNSYMAAIVFHGVHKGLTRHKVRITPFYILARSRATLGPGFTNYSIGSQGVKTRVMKFFGDMLKDGVIANEESLCIVMTALAREGDIATVKATLRRMWNIDIDALQSGKDEATLKPKAMPLGNPLRPTAELLFTIAHAFGINNDIPTALRLVDFIARHYDLKITKETWGQLFEWTFVLSIPRSGAKSKTDSTKNGQLPQQALIHLWNTMTGAPYFVSPTMGMYNHMIRSLQNQDRVPQMYERMREGIDLYYVERRDAFQAFKFLEKQVQKVESGQLHSHSTRLEQLRREWERLDLIRRRNHFWAKRWLRLLLTTMRARVAIDRENYWSLRAIPSILWEWRNFAGTHGNNIIYETANGVVEFKIRGQEEVDEAKAFKERITARQRAVLDKVPLLVGEQWVSGKQDEPQWAWHQHD